MMDYYDSLNPSKELVVKFQDCVFRDNQYFGNEAYPALIFGNSDQNRLILEKTIFENNDMMWNNTNVSAHTVPLYLFWSIQLHFSDHLFAPPLTTRLLHPIYSRRKQTAF